MAHAQRTRPFPISTSKMPSGGAFTKWNNPAKLVNTLTTNVQFAKQ